MQTSLTITRYASNGTNKGDPVTTHLNLIILGSLIRLSPSGYLCGGLIFTLGTLLLILNPFITSCVLSRWKLRYGLRTNRIRWNPSKKSLDCAIVSLLSGSTNGILSIEDMERLTLLKSDKKKILEHYLLTWKLKSRTKWALYGDSNTKYFHMMASGRRNQNSIWSLYDDDGNCYEDEEALKVPG